MTARWPTCWQRTSLAAALLVLLTAVQPASSVHASPSEVTDADALEITVLADRQVRVELIQQSDVDPSTVSGRSKDLHPLSAMVQLPVAPEPQPGRGYPLLVLLHGSGGTSTTWSERANLLQDERLRDVVVLSLDGGHYGMYTNWMERGRARWSDLHEAMITAVIDTFGVSDDRSDRAIVGVSMGGQGALRYASRWPTLFGTVGALSPALPDMRSPEVVVSYPLQVSAKAGTWISYRDTWGPVLGPEARAANPMDLISGLRDTKVHLTSGDGTRCAGEEWPAPEAAVTEAAISLQTRHYARALRNEGVDVTTTYHCGGHGDWGWWRRGFDETLARWQPPA